MTPFSTLLVANRGEIACRIIGSARSLGLRTVAVYSDADLDARHVRLADLAVHIGPAAAAASYLSIDRLLDAAGRSGADAVHPGYGFLSENPAFASACAQAGLRFVGPPPEAIRLMGNKALARRRMAELGIPTIPGWEGEAQDEEALLAAAETLGYPVLVKAAAGGGGRGMRLVHAPAELPAALRAARAEAQSAFADGRLLLERALVGARHVEVQVLADGQGNVVHLGERDCSIQRRYQKIVEEAPSPAVDPGLRARMGATAVAVARGIGYQGAGTVEFLLDAKGSFHFLEMNTRLQVEHPVTEMITGLDLVALQLRIAAGEPLPFTQAEVPSRGHAIEVRLYAEDPQAGFLPQTGRLGRWTPGAPDPGRRIDHGLCAGQEITAHYDPLLAKLVAWGETRELARRRLSLLLADTVALGVTTNKSFLATILAHPAFVAGTAHTGFIEGTPPAPTVPPWLRAAAAVLLSVAEGRGAAEAQPPIGSDSEWTIPFSEVGKVEETGVLLARVRLDGPGSYRVRFDGEPAEQALVFLPAPPGEARVLADGIQRRLHWARAEGELHLDAGSLALCYRATAGQAERQAAAVSDGRVLAPMNGRIVSVNVGKGDRVARGQVVLVLEAMKMQCQVVSDLDGLVAGVLVGADAQVVRRQLLVEITPQGASA